MRTFFAIIASLWVAGCTVENGVAPPAAGPSEFGLSVSLRATPDQLPRDGASQSVVTVTVRDASGRPVAGQRLSVSSSLGTVSQSEVVTGNEGTATFAVVAPGEGAIGRAVVVQAVPVGTNADDAVGRTVSILLTGASNSTRPTPSFAYTPTSPQANQAVRFDASATTDEGAACLDACTYSWDFGNGSTGTGRIVSHTFTSGRTYSVTLTVTDAAGSSASTAQTVTVAAVAAPIVTALTVLPDPPIEDFPAAFAATVTVASGHSISSYAWTFGDGTSQTTTGASTTKTYSSPGRYVVTVTATDDTGQTGSRSLSFVIVTSGARFTFSPTDPTTADTVRFNASSSTGPSGATITNYAWDFGDGSTTDGSDATATHRYSAARTYVVRLTVTYSSGGTGTTTQDVTVE